MKRKFLLPVAGVVAAAAIVTIISPRAVHAITAAMVQVVNTPTNALPTVHAPAASQLYSSYCYGSFSNPYPNSASCQLAAVPAGQSLVIETVSTAISPDKGIYPFQAQIFGLSDTGTSGPTVWIPIS